MGKRKEQVGYLPELQADRGSCMKDEKNSINNIDKMNESDKAAMEALFSELDKGIDDMEAGRVFPIEDAFQMIEDMLDKETN